MLGWNYYSEQMVALGFKTFPSFNALHPKVQDLFSYLAREHDKSSKSISRK